MTQAEPLIATLIDVDPERGAAHRNLAAHLTSPFQGGAKETPLVLAADGTARVDWVSRQPLLLVELLATCDQHGLAVTVTVTPDGGAAATTTLQLAPFSEASTCLPAWLAAPGSASDTAPPFSIQVAVTPSVSPSATAATTATPPAATTLVAVRVVEGVLGRLLYAIGSEKPRLRRQMRELVELRRLSFAFDDTPEHARMGNALDQLGADLRVPRLTAALAWDPVAQQVTSTNVAESNESYRERLELFRGFALPTCASVQTALQELTGATTATVADPNSDFAFAIKLISAPDDTARTTFLNWLRTAHLVTPGSPTPATWLLPSAVRGALDQALTRIGAQFAFPAGSLIAPALAELLDRVGRCRAALGVTRPWKVLHAQDNAGGSRFELGLGVELEVPPAAELDAMAAALTAKTFTAGADPATLALLGALAGVASATDPVGRWLVAPCGAATVHQSAAGVFISHLPMFGVRLVADTAPNSFQAHFEAPGDPGQDAVLWYALKDVAADAAAATIPAWTALTGAAATTALAAATAPAAATLGAFAAAGLAAPASAADVARAVTGVAAVAPERVAVLQLAAALAAGVIANTAAQVQQLTAIVASCAAHELGSVLPLVSGANVLLVVSSAPMLGATSLVGSAQRLLFRWSVVGVQGAEPGTLSVAAGPRSAYLPPTTATTAAPTLSAVVAITLARKDRDDPRDRIEPFASRVTVPDGTLIDLAMYERVMNYLERVAPVGVVLDTYKLRASHIDPATTGKAVPFTGRLAATFREFQLARRRGAIAEDATD